MGCAVSSQTVRPDISDGTGLQNRASNSQIVEKASASSLGGDAQNYDTQSTHGLANDVSNMLSSPNEENTVGVHEGNSATCSSIESHLVDSTGLFYCDVANIINPQNMIAAIKRGDTEVVKALCRGTKGQNASGINSLGTDKFSKCDILMRHTEISSASLQLTVSALQYQECGIPHH